MQEAKINLLGHHNWWCAPGPILLEAGHVPQIIVDEHSRRLPVSCIQYLIQADIATANTSNKAHALNLMRPRKEALTALTQVLQKQLISFLKAPDRLLTTWCHSCSFCSKREAGHATEQKRSGERKESVYFLLAHKAHIGQRVQSFSSRAKIQQGDLTGIQGEGESRSNLGQELWQEAGRHGAIRPEGLHLATSPLGGKEGFSDEPPINHKKTVSQDNFLIIHLVRPVCELTFSSMHFKTGTQWTLGRLYFVCIC